jgi:hypothetical protein
MGHFEGVAAETEGKSRKADEAGFANGGQCHLLYLADRLSMGELAERISKLQERVLSLSQVMSGWNLGRG